jgi:hypothetical protein
VSHNESIRIVATYDIAFIFSDLCFFGIGVALIMAQHESLDAGRLKTKQDL